MALSAIANNKQGKTFTTIRKRKEVDDTQIHSKLTEKSSATGWKHSCKTLCRTQGTNAFKKHETIFSLYISMRS
jgi:hypothetical protein